MKIGHWYKFNDRGSEYIGQYTGTDQNFECCVCGKGHKAHTFNIWYSITDEKVGDIAKADKDHDYETWGFGNNHLPKIIEDLGEQENIIIGE